MKNIGKILFFCLIFIYIPIVSMYSLRRIPPQVKPRSHTTSPFVQKRSIQTAQSAPSFWSNMQQAASQFVNKILNKYYSPHIKPLPTVLGQSEITSMPLAATIETLGQEDVNKILEIIKANRKLYNLENDMNGLLRCGTPGPEFLIVSAIKSIADFEKFFENMRRRLFLSAGFDAESTEKLLATIKQKRENAIKNFYTEVRSEVTHENIALLNKVKGLLIRVGINPNTIPIKNIPIIRAMRNFGTMAIIEPSFDKNGQIIGSKMSFNPLNADREILLLGFIKLKLKASNVQTFIIAHEIGHLIRNHCEEAHLISKEFARLFPYELEQIGVSLPSYKDLEEQFGALYELEADIAVSMQSPETAAIIADEIFKVYQVLNPSERTKSMSPIHSSFAHKWELFSRIYNLHQAKRKDASSRIIQSKE